MPNSNRPESKVSFRSNNEIAIHVPDLAQAEAFYSGVLGFRITSRSDDQLEFETGAFRLYVNQDTEPRSFIPSFDVPDYAAAKRLLEAAGCMTVEAGLDSHVTYFLDPFGFAFDITQPSKDI